MTIQRRAVYSAFIISTFALPAGAETLDTLAEFGNAATANANSDANIPRGASFDNAAAGTYSITAGGTDIWGNSDNGSYIYDADGTRAAGENFSVIVRSVSIAADPLEGLATEWGRTGIMARKTPNSATSANVANIRKTGGAPSGTIHQGRQSDGAGTDRGPGNSGEHLNSAENRLNGSVRDTPIWLGLHRFEGEWYSTWAPDNAGSPGEWSSAIQRAGTPDMAGEVYVGLAHQSHNINPIVNTAAFESFSVNPFDIDLGAFPVVAASCDLTASGAGVNVTASGIELGATASTDVDWEVRYIGAEETVQGKLKADIYLAANPGNLGAIQTLLANNEPNGSTQIEQIHWASNSYTTTNAGGVNLFAQAVPGSFGGDQGDYGVVMAGEIHIPNDVDRDNVESILFHDGCDDYCYLEIDGQVLIDNNAWSNLAGTGNGGGTQGSLDVSNVKFNDGEWVSFRMIFWEGGGGDDCVIVWDALDRTGTDSVTGATDGNQSSYLGTGLGAGDKISFAHDLTSDKIPAQNFRALVPGLKNSVTGFGQPNNVAIASVTSDVLYLELHVNGELCATVSTVVSVESAEFTASDEITLVLADAGSGGIADLDQGSLSVELDGTSVGFSVSSSGGLTTVTYTFPSLPNPFTNYTLVVTGNSTGTSGNLPISLSTTARSLPLLDELRAGQTAPPNSTVGWDYMEFDVIATLGVGLGAGEQAFTDAQTVISTAVSPLAQANQPYINHSDPDNPDSRGDWAPDLPILSDNAGIDDNQYVTYARTTITIGAAEVGDYTIRVTGDDGFGLRINGASFTSVAGDNTNRIIAVDPSVVYRPTFGGNGNALAVCNFPVAGDYLVEFFGFEGGGGSYQEVSWVNGAFTNVNQSQDWTLLGDTSSFVPVSLWGDIPEGILPPADGEAGWSTYLYYNAAVGSLANTMNYLRDVADPANAVATILPALNHSDDAVDAGRFNPTEAFPGDPNVGTGTDNIGMISRAFVIAPVAGDYTIQVRSDDGFLLRFANPGTTFSSIDGAGSLRATALNEVYFAAGTGDSNTRATVNLTAGVHELIFIWWEGGGGSHFEVSSAPGVEPSQDGPYELLSTTVSATNLYVTESAPVELAISEITRLSDPDRISLTFNSRLGTIYSIKADTDLVGFETVIDNNVVGDGSAFTYGPFINPFPGEPRVFFRVELVE